MILALIMLICVLTNQELPAAAAPQTKHIPIKFYAHSQIHDLTRSVPVSELTNQLNSGTHVTMTEEYPGGGWCSFCTILHDRKRFGPLQGTGRNGLIEILEFRIQQLKDDQAQEDWQQELRGWNNLNLIPAASKLL